MIVIDCYRLNLFQDVVCSVVIFSLRFQKKCYILSMMTTHPKRQKSIGDLERAILNLHGCKATWVKSVPVKEVFEGQTAWEGVVQVFDLIGHPKATRCYAWSHGLDNSKKRRFFTVLHQGTVDSPEKAVRAAIVNEVRKNGI